jgi:dsRNA-specific ribonuclease
MSGEHPELDALQAAYKDAVEAWIAAIRDVAGVDQWEKAHFEEERMRSTVKAAKEKYEDALREKFFGF